jgi:MoxR-like ATPase
LPEAQLDRFLVALNLGYPSYADEIMILEREEHQNPLDQLQPILDMPTIERLQLQARQVEVARPLKEYIVQLSHASRTHADVVLGVSPRGGVALQRCAQALALLRGRAFVTPDDVKTAFPAVGGHRILTRDRNPQTAQTVIAEILQTQRVPVE